MSIESTLGGLAMAGDGSSWPTTGPLVLADIRNEIADPTLQEILVTMVCGIMEVHANMLCVFLAAMPFMSMTDPTLKAAIEKVKSGATCADGPAALAERSSAFAEVHAIISESYRAALRGDDGVNQEALIARILSTSRTA